jgi:antitoxin HigA-1
VRVVRACEARVASRSSACPRRRARQPPHPGAVLRNEVLPALRISQQAFADRLGVSGATVDALLRERRDLSPELAARIGRLLGHAGERWMHLQTRLDLWRIEQDVQRLAGVEPLATALSEPA